MSKGEHIRRLRSLAGLSLASAGDLIGVSESHLSRMERGQRTLHGERMEEVEAVLVPLAKRRASILVGEEVALVA